MTEEEEKGRSGERADASEREIFLKECDPAKFKIKILTDGDKYCLLKHKWFKHSHNYSKLKFGEKQLQYNMKWEEE